MVSPQPYTPPKTDDTRVRGVRREEEEGDDPRTLCSVRFVALVTCVVVAVPLDHPEHVCGDRVHDAARVHVPQACGG